MEDFCFTDDRHTGNSIVNGPQEAEGAEGAEGEEGEKGAGGVEAEGEEIVEGTSDGEFLTKPIPMSLNRCSTPSWEIVYPTTTTTASSALNPDEDGGSKASTNGDVASWS